MSFSAGIDLGGTKILSAVFDKSWQPVFSHRVATPGDSYDALLSEVVTQIEWVLAHTDVATIGLGVPGVLDRQSCQLRVANLAADGHCLSADLEKATGINISLINDSKAFALSEACLGAGAGYRSVLGISVGTGTAAGLVIDGRVLSEAAGMAGEIGHMSIPAVVAQRKKLPMIRCTCGKTGCYETFVCGPGLVRLGQAMYDSERRVQEWSDLYRQGDRQAANLMKDWYEILAAMITEAMLCYDPECIVFGGGLSGLPAFIPEVKKALADTDRLNNHLPALFTAHGREFSGARGAALQAKNVSSRAHI